MAEGKCFRRGGLRVVVGVVVWLLAWVVARADVGLQWPVSGLPLPWTNSDGIWTVRSPLNDGTTGQTIKGVASTLLSDPLSQGDGVTEMVFELKEPRTVVVSWIFTRNPILGSGGRPSEMTLDAVGLQTGAENLAPATALADFSYDYGLPPGVPAGTPMTQVNARSTAPVFSFPGGGVGGEVGRASKTLALPAGIHVLRFSEGTWTDNGLGYRTRLQSVRVNSAGSLPTAEMVASSILGGGNSLVDGRLKVAIAEGYRIKWTTNDSVSIRVEGIDDGFLQDPAIASGESDFGSGKTIAGDYRYFVVGKNSIGEARAEVTVSVQARDVLLQNTASIPFSGITPISQQLALGASVSMALGSNAAGNWKSGQRLSGPGLLIDDPGTFVSFTPSSVGRFTYTYQVLGYNRLKWRGVGATRFFLRLPDSSEIEVTSLLYYDTITPGDYVIIAADAAGNNRVESGAVSLGPPPSASSSAEVVVVPRIDAFNVQAPPAPTVTASVSPATLTLGQAASLQATTTDTSAVKWTGPGGFSSSSLSPSTTPGAAGRLHYDVEALPLPGRLSWRVTGADRLTLDGAEVVTGEQETFLPGIHELVAYGRDGTENRASVTLVMPPSAAAGVDLMVNPRVDLFEAVNPLPPSASLVLPVPNHVLFGDAVTATVSATNQGRTVLDGNGVHSLDTQGGIVFTPFLTGIHDYLLTVDPLPYGTLRWRVAGATSVEIDGVVRAGTEWTEAPPGTHRLRGLGPDGTASSESTAVISLPPAATSSGRLFVHPKIRSFAATNPEAPSLSLGLTPATGLVAPAAVAVAWSSSQTSAVTVTAEGRDDSWTSHDASLTRSLTLVPGPHRYKASAERLPSTFTWEVAGSESLFLEETSGARSEITSQAQPLEASRAGDYILRAVGRDGLETLSDLQTISFPPPATKEISVTVDTFLTLASEAEGSVSGGGVIPFNTEATASALSKRGYHFDRWTGDVPSSDNPFRLLMQDNHTLTAHYAPNAYQVRLSVRPEGTATVSGAGFYLFGSDATVAAVPQPYHRFVRWSGGLSGAVASQTFRVEDDVVAVAETEWVQFHLTLNKIGDGGGTLSPASGDYQALSDLNLTATPDAVSRFMGWSGDVSGGSRTLALRMLRDFSVRASFEPKLRQVISFQNPGDQEVDKGTRINGSSDSGLPVRYTVVLGPAELSGGMLFVRGAGAVTLRAEQDGDDTYLPATPVEVSFQGFNAPVLKLKEETGDTHLHDSTQRHPNKVL